MSWLRKLWQRVRAVKPRQWAFGALAVVIGFAVLMGILYVWDYTNSPPFCGTTCHTMPPEYSAWQRSPHARVNCVECHLGRDFITTTFTRKAGDLMHVIRYSSGNFTFPLYATTMIPAREACEKCHWPNKFADDRSVAIRHFDPDATNSEVDTYLLLKTGGGTQSEGRGKGIHWHIENNVVFIATDDLKQDIPWVQVTDASGKVTTYTDIEDPLTPDQIAKADKHRMDCIDCHNRVSHTFQSPEQAIDQALALKRIDANIPFIKKNAVDVLSAPYKSFNDADKAIAALDATYAKDYPDFYRGGSASIQSAIENLKSLYKDLVFPTQDLSWNTHPDNLGHKDWPGCFRCHDGKHLTQDNKQAIRLECNVCHTLPEVNKQGGPAPIISLARSDEPDSHKTTTWIFEHRTVFNSTCQACHDTNNAGGKDNSSFCSNAACHGTVWRFVGLNAPALTKLYPVPVPPKPDPNATPKLIPHPIGGSPDCQICHGQGSKVHPYPSDHVGRANDVCLACHKPSIPPNATTQTTGTSAGGPPPITHDTAGRTQCLGCHGSGAAGVPQIPQFHKDYGFTNNNCLTCHKSSVGVKPAAAPTVAAPTATPQAKPSAAPTSAATAAPSAGAPLKIPPSHVGRTAGCVACHSSGVGGAPKFPATHASFTDDLCKTCHQGP
ncbi:MAG: NapC/NirT family cytochrome c [Chloroflexota bacterium]|nr:NapC/NirT family cytochrome c [Chloroflexota bacterium]